MSLPLIFFQAWPRTVTVGFRVSALALLFYGASFYTRDWRSVVPDVGQPAQAQAAVRPMAGPLPAHAVLGEPSAPAEPATTGALSRTAANVAGPEATEAVTRPVA